MPVICPKCRHVRPPDATNPDWQCPSCGVCYAKVGSQAAQPARVVVAAVDMGRGLSLGWLPVIALVVALGWGLKHYVDRQPGEPADEVASVEEDEETDSGEALANSMLKMSGADSSMFGSIARGMEKACARNPRGMSEETCLDRLHEREETCTTATAQRFPGQIGDTKRLQAITLAYADCVFDD